MQWKLSVIPTAIWEGVHPYLTSTSVVGRPGRGMRFSPACRSAVLGGQLNGSSVIRENTCDRNFKVSLFLADTAIWQRNPGTRECVRDITPSSVLDLTTPWKAFLDRSPFSRVQMRRPSPDLLGYSSPPEDLCLGPQPHIEEHGTTHGPSSH